MIEGNQVHRSLSKGYPAIAGQAYRINFIKSRAIAGITKNYMVLTNWTPQNVKRVSFTSRFKSSRWLLLDSASLRISTGTKSVISTEGESVKAEHLKSDRPGEVWELFLSTLPQLINAEYENKEISEQILGADGMIILSSLVDAIKETARQKWWPLDQIFVRNISDAELTEWKYALVVACLKIQSDKIDKYLDELYETSDNLVSSLSSQQQDLYQRKIFVDIRAII